MGCTTLVARCGACQREQRLELPGVGGWAVRAVAELLDGSSTLYVDVPDDHRIVGRCGRCGGKVECEVVEVSELVVPTDGVTAVPVVGRA